VGNGNEVSFWLDNWIEDQSLLELLGIENNSLLDPNTKVSEFIHNAQWDIQKLNKTLQNYQIIQKIIGIVLPIIETDDSFCWGLNGSGFFTSKLSHNALPVRGTLFRCGCDIKPHCPLCAADVVSIDHLFWGC